MSEAIATIDAGLPGFADGERARHEGERCRVVDTAAAAAGRIAHRCKLLDRFPLLTGLPPAVLEHVARHATELHLDEGQVLFFKDDVADFLALVLDGQLHELLYGPAGQELILAAPGPFETVDEAVLLDAGTRSFTATAGIRAHVLVLHRRHFPALLAVPEVMERTTSLLRLRLRRAIDCLESIGLHRLESRLARYLLLRAASPGRGAGPTADIILPSTQSILAAMLNVSRSKLNAQLQAWQRSGLASREGNTLRVHDFDQLRRKAYLPAGAGNETSPNAPAPGMRLEMPRRHRRCRAA